MEQLEQPAARSNIGCSSYGALPAIGTSIEVQWADQDENTSSGLLQWLAVKPDVTRLEARQEKRFDRLAKCEVPPNPVHRVAE
jgi:hypothetical protein